MGKILQLILILSSSIALGQNPEKLLTKEQLDSVKNGYSILKEIDKHNCNYFDNFQGTVRVFKDTGKIYFDFIDKSSRYDRAGKLNAQYTATEDGNGLKAYQEFDSSGQVVYDCNYDYKVIDGTTYRLEHLRLYYEPNTMRYDGYRYLKVRNQKGPLTGRSQHKYGVWNYYDKNGRLESSKNYGEIR